MKMPPDSLGPELVLNGPLILARWSVEQKAFCIAYTIER